MPPFVAFKAKRPQAVLRLRGRLTVWCALDSARGGLGAMLTPVPCISPAEKHTIAQVARRGQEERLQLQIITSQVTGCNLHCSR